MPRKFRVSDGVVAVWDGIADYLPFFNPLAHLNRVKFHSVIPYVKIIDTKVFSVTIPAITGFTPQRPQSYTLGAHGRPGQPFVIGRIIVNGVPVAFTGSVPVHKLASSTISASGDPYARFLSLGVDASNVYVHEYAVQLCNVAANACDSRPAQTFSIAVYITDILL